MMRTGRGHLRLYLDSRPQASHCRPSWPLPLRAIPANPELDETPIAARRLTRLSRRAVTAYTENQEAADRWPG